MKRLLAPLAMLTVAACGFTPVYAPPPGTSGVANAGPIQITEIEGRTGHFLRQEMVRSVGQGVPGVKGPATLEIKLAENIVRLGFAPDQAASRSDYVGTAQWTLRGGDGNLIANGNAREAASFNFADAAYGDIAAQTAAKERVATLLARSIRDQILFAAADPDKAMRQPPADLPTTTSTTTTTLLPSRPGE